MDECIHQIKRTQAFNLGIKISQLDLNQPKHIRGTFCQNEIIFTDQLPAKTLHL